VVPWTRAIVPDPAVRAGIVPERFAELTLNGGQLCCPLLADGDRLFACACTGTLEDGDASSVVFALHMQSKERESFPVGNWHINAASVIANGALYWAGETRAMDGRLRSHLVQLPLRAAAVPTSTPGTGGLYRNATALADASGVHLQTSGLGDEGEERAVVYLLHHALSGELTGMDPLGNSVVFQIAQDADHFYAVSNRDDGPGPFQRVTSVVRIDKRTRATSTLLNPRTLEISELDFSGYIGLVSDGSDVFALFESAPRDGRERFQIGRVMSPGSAGPSDLTPIYDIEVPSDPRVTLVRLLGALDGAVFFAREELFEGGRFNASMLMIRRGQERAEFLADFSGDTPVDGIVASDDRVFWLTRTGRIYAIPRETLAP
jgi:hypothetical protein